MPAMIRVLLCSMLLALAATLTACDRAPVDAGDAASNPTQFLRGEGAADFAQALEPRSFEFPRDHGSHPRYRVEWWYFTGNVAAQSDRHFGFELTFFRFALAARPPQRASDWGTGQIWMAHFAVADVSSGELIAEERFAREALGLAGAEHTPLRVWVGDWSASGDLQSGTSLRASGERAALALELSSLKPVVLQGADGLDLKGDDPGEASYYYSLTRMSAAGTITVDGREHAVSGTAWMDREWSSGALSEELAGWDWFALQLSDGRDLMFYRLRQHDGDTSRHSGGALVETDGTRQPLTANDVILTELDHWVSPTSGSRYPVRWRLTLPGEDLTLEVQPYLREQELVLSVRYWEGAVRAVGTHSGRPIGGQGYVELTGY